MLDPGRQIRQVTTGEVGHFLVGLARIDLDHRGPGRDHVAQGTDRQRQVFVNHLPGLRGFGGFEQRVPQPGKELDIAAQFGLIGPLGRGADDAAADIALVATGFEQAAQALALQLVLDLDRDTDDRRVRHIDQVARRHRYGRGQARALGTHRILDDLHQQRLALAQQLVDRRPRAAVFVAGAAVAEIDVGDVQKTGLFQADIDEGGLHAGQNPVDLAQVNITDDATAAFTLDTDLLQGAVLDDRHAGLLGRNVQQYFFVQGHSYNNSIPASRNSSAVS